MEEQTKTKSQKANGGNGQPHKFNQAMLDQSLRHAEDVFDRANIFFFLAGETAIQIKNSNKLDDLPEISLGVRETDWGDIQQRLFKTTMELLNEEWKRTKDGFEFVKDGVPIKVKVFRKHKRFFGNLDKIIYDNTHYLIPNQFKKYVKMRNLLK